MKKMLSFTVDVECFLYSRAVVIAKYLTVVLVAGVLEMATPKCSCHSGDFQFVSTHVSTLVNVKRTNSSKKQEDFKSPSTCHCVMIYQISNI